jgi:hypothetical protein
MEPELVNFTCRQLISLRLPLTILASLNRLTDGGITGAPLLSYLKSRARTGGAGDSGEASSWLGAILH